MFHVIDGTESIPKKRSLKSYGQVRSNSLGVQSSKRLDTNTFKNLAQNPVKSLKQQPSKHSVKKRFLNTDLDIDLDNSLYELQDYSNMYNRLHQNDGLQVKVGETGTQKKVGVKVEKGKVGVNVQLTASKGEQEHQGKADSNKVHQIQLDIVPHKPQSNSQPPLQSDQGQSNMPDSPQDELSGVKVQSGPVANSIQISVKQRHPASSSGSVKISMGHPRPFSGDVQGINDQPLASLVEDKPSSLDVLSDMMPTPELLKKRVNEILEETSPNESIQKHREDIVVSVKHKHNTKTHRTGSLDIIQAEDKKNEELTKMIEELSERAIEKLERTNKAIENILMTVETDDDHMTDASDGDTVEITAGHSDPISVTIEKKNKKTELQNEAVAELLLGDDDSSESDDRTVVSIDGVEDQLLDITAAVRENEKLQLQTEALADSLTDLELGISPDLTKKVRHEHKMTAKIIHALEKETSKLKQKEIEEKQHSKKQVIHHIINISTMK